MSNKKKIITLAKELDFSTEDEYYNYICDSYINGQMQQVRKLFAAMRKGDQKYFIENIRDYSENKEFYSYILDLI